MSTPFAIDVANSVFRAVINGDNALAPSSPANVIFDAFGQPYNGVFKGGVVASSTFTAAGTTVPPNASNATLYTAAIALGKTFSKPPQLIWLCQNPSTGGWGQQYTSGTISYVNSGGVLFPRGSFLNVFGYATTTSVVLGYQIVNFPSPVSVSPPPNFSWRVFQT